MNEQTNDYQKYGGRTEQNGKKRKKENDITIDENVKSMFILKLLENIFVDCRFDRIVEFNAMQCDAMGCDVM